MKLGPQNRLLFVDEINTLVPLLEICMRRGCQVLKSTHVYQAMRLVQALSPTAVLADIHIAGGGAMYLVSLLKRQHPRTPIFCFVPNHNSGFIEAKSDLILMGADGVFPIPFEAETALVEIETKLESLT